MENVEKNENLVTEEVAENVEQTTEQTPKTYTQDEVDAIVGRRVARNERKIRKEYERKYGDLEEVLRAGTGKEKVEEMTDTFRQFYEDKGVKIPQKDIKDVDISDELAADLVGDYLFSDPDFINRLSTENRNVFQKIFDEIKYLCKVVTAGSKEARELEKVKKAFEQVWRENATEKDVTETRYSLENKGKGKYNKRSKYSESETLFMSWENASAPVGEVKKFNRFGKTRYYEKTENGCVELSRSQYNERNGLNGEDTYGRIQRQVNGIADSNGTSERNLSGSMDGDRDAGRTYAVSGQTFGEELRNDIAGSVSSDDGHDRRNGLTQTEYNEEASDESGASFVTFSNDYATMVDNGVITQETADLWAKMYPNYVRIRREASGDKTGFAPISEKNVRSNLVTVYSPTFAVKNPIRDAQDVLFNSQHAAKTYAKIPEAYMQILVGKTGGDAYWYNEYAENGGVQEQFFDSKKGSFIEKDNAVASAIK